MKCNEVKTIFCKEERWSARTAASHDFIYYSKSALNASYTVAGCVACSKKAFTIAEELILPSAINMSQEVIGEAAASKLELVSLSNNTTTRRIEIRDDIECQLLERIKIQSVLFHTIG